MMHKQSLGTAARAYGGIIQHWSQRPRPPAPAPVPVRACCWTYNSSAHVLRRSLSARAIRKIRKLFLACAIVIIDYSVLLYNETFIHTYYCTFYAHSKGLSRMITRHTFLVFNTDSGVKSPHKKELHYIF